jgi:hypothetical protein
MVCQAFAQRNRHFNKINNHCAVADPFLAKSNKVGPESAAVQLSLAPLMANHFVPSSQFAIFRLW